MAAPPPRPSARNAGARGGTGAPSGGGAARGPSHASQNSSLGSGASGSSTKSDKGQGTFFLGRYRVVEEIGVGGMASVHLGRMDGPGGFQKWVAIKRIHPNLVEDDQFVDMFLDEARIAAGINHANVAQVFDLGKDEGTYWIAMEYLHGEPLRELMRRCEERNQRISCDIAARVCADAAEGLHAAHELRGKNNQLLGLVHRDVTPHNLFITYEGYTKVVDFGIAKVADRLSETRAGTLKGKLAYMSPEQVRGQDDVDRTTDIFALGVVLWELTTGHRLFRMDTDLDTLEKVQACVVPPPSTIVPGYPIELESVVMKALAKKKPERYQTARELSRSLQMYLQRRGVLIGPEEVSQFVRDMFSDRIKAREAHLAWAADVTSTINIDQLNAMKSGRSPGRGSLAGDELSSKSLSDPSDGPRTVAMSADVGKPSVPGLAMPPIRPSTNGAMDPSTPMMSQGHMPPHNSQFGGPSSQRPQQDRPQQGNTQPNNDPRRAPAPPPTVPHSPAAKSPQNPHGVPSIAAASTSLVDDDEDIPTTVATREQVHDLAAVGGVRRESFGNNHPGGAFPSIRATTMGMGAQHAGQHGRNPHESGAHSLGSTVALPPGAGAVSPSPPTFGPPPAASSQPGFNRAPQQSHPGMQGNPWGGYQGQGTQVQNAPPAFGPPPQMYGNHQPNPPPLGAQTPSSAFQMPPAAQPGRHPPPSAIETALSLPRPDPGAWAQSHVKSSDRMSTAVLIAVAVLTAICVLALGALIYFRYSQAPTPPPTGVIDVSAAAAPTERG